MATHSSILAWRIPRTEELGGATVYGVAKSQTGVSDFAFTFTQGSIGYGSLNLYLSDCKTQVDLDLNAMMTVFSFSQCCYWQTSRTI